MMFARRSGEILFRPVEKIDLVLVGDPKPLDPYRYMTGWDWGEESSRFKQMYLNSWEPQPEESQPTYGGIERASTIHHWPKVPDKFYEDSQPYPPPIPRPPVTYYPPGLKQREAMESREPMMLYGSHGGGKTERLRQLSNSYRNLRSSNEGQCGTTPSAELVDRSAGLPAG